jgi:uncharacterized protein (TIRG00374 family)
MAKAKKIIFLAAKALVTALLLLWVFSKVHWHDYVQSDKAGKEIYSVVEIRERPPGQPDRLLVSTGHLWWKTPPVEMSAQECWPSDRRLAPPGANKPSECLPHPRYSQVRLEGMAASLAKLNPWFMAAACACYLVMLLILGVRFWFLLRIQDIHIGLWEAMRLTFLGYLYSNAIPGTVGGDVIKAWYVAKHTPRKAAVIVSIFVDRMMGLTELTLLAIVMVTVVMAGRLPCANIRQAQFVVVVLVAVLIGGFFFVLSARFRRMLRLEKIYQRWSFGHHIAAMGEAAQLYRHRIGSLVKAVGVTFGAHIIWIAGIALIGLSLHIDTKLYNYFLNTPLIYILAAGIPTPGGVGGVEALYCVAFSDVNISQVFALAVLARMMTIFCGLPGAIVAITGPKLPKSAAMQTELEEAVERKT